MFTKIFYTILFLLLMIVLLLEQPVVAEQIDKKISVGTQKVTLDFKKIAIRELLELFADELHYNIIINEDVTGSVALHLKEVTWSQALEALLNVAGLAKKIEHNLLYVGTPANFATRQQNLQQAALLKTVRVVLHHIDAEQASTFLKTQADFLSPLAKIICNLRDNSLWIKETADNLPLVLDFLQQSDVPDKQILITAKVINLDEKQKCELGVKFNSCVASKISNKGTLGTEEVNNRFNFAILTMSQNQQLNIELDALEKTGHSTIVADPTIIAQNRKTATIEAGEDIPYQEKTASGATSVAFKKAALSLKVTPTVLPDHRITLDLEISQNKVLPLSVNGTPAIQTQELKTQVVIRADQSIILGGIYETDHAKVKTTVPFIGQIPVVGALVGHSDQQHVKRELLILISPHLL
jgi:type IV pilus assembly protein PilQ